MFISYRRADSADAAGRLYDSLDGRLDGQVFMDIDTIEPGLDFVDVVNDAVGSCDVLLALIGQHWLSSAEPQGKRRLDDPNDLVRMEIEAALERNVRVIPLLLQGASMPSAGDLPESLRPLARRHALDLTHTRWHFDVGILLETLKRLAQARSVRGTAPAEPTIDTEEPTVTPGTEPARTADSGRAVTEEIPSPAATPEPPRPRRRAPIVWIASAVVVVGAAVGVGLALAGRSSGPSTSSEAESPATAAVLQSGAESSRSESIMLDAYISNVQGVLEGSASDVANLSSAVRAAQNGDASAPSRIQNVADARALAVATVQTWVIPEAAIKANRLLVSALQLSARADGMWVTWARQILNGDTSGADSTKADITAFQDGRVHPAKRSFIAAFNPLLSQVGQPTLPADYNF